MEFYDVGKMQEIRKLITEQVSDFNLSLDQISAIVSMGNSPSQQDIAKIKQWVGGCDLGEEDVGPTTTKILDLVRGFVREGDTLYFDSSTVLVPHGPVGI